MEESRHEACECPVCLVKMSHGGTIWQCDRGHLVCGTCKEKINNRCPICRAPRVQARNTFAESVLGEDTGECEHPGCGRNMQMRDMWNHMQECEYRPFPCCLCKEKVTARHMEVHAHGCGGSMKMTTGYGADIYLEHQINRGKDSEWKWTLAGTSRELPSYRLYVSVTGPVGRKFMDVKMSGMYIGHDQRKPDDYFQVAARTLPPQGGTPGYMEFRISPIDFRLGKQAWASHIRVKVDEFLGDAKAFELVLTLQRPDFERRL